MSLTDLKKQSGRTKKEKVSVDEFIEQANLYAKGKSPPIDKKRVLKKGRNYKNATFTLAPVQIEQLNSLAKNSGLSKSHIVRLLITELAKENDLTIDALLDHIERT